VMGRVKSVDKRLKNNVCNLGQKGGGFLTRKNQDKAFVRSLEGKKWPRKSPQPCQEGKKEKGWNANHNRIKKVEYIKKGEGILGIRLEGKGGWEDRCFALLEKGGKTIP